PHQDAPLLQPPAGGQLQRAEADLDHVVRLPPGREPALPAGRFDVDDDDVVESLGHRSSSRFQSSRFQVTGADRLLTRRIGRRIDLPLRLAFLTASSYRGASTTPGKLLIQADLLPDLTGRHVLLLDDILDTGKTLTRVVAHLIDRGAESVKVGVLLRKIGRQE